MVNLIAQSHLGRLAPFALQPLQRRGDDEDNLLAVTPIGSMLRATSVAEITGYERAVYPALTGLPVLVPLLVGLLFGLLCGIINGTYCSGRSACTRA